MSRNRIDGRNASDARGCALLKYERQQAVIARLAQAKVGMLVCEWPSYVMMGRKLYNRKVVDPDSDRCGNSESGVDVCRVPRRERASVRLHGKFPLFILESRRSCSAAP